MTGATESGEVYSHAEQNSNRIKRFAPYAAAALIALILFLYLIFSADSHEASPSSPGNNKRETNSDASTDSEIGANLPNNSASKESFIEVQPLANALIADDQAGIWARLVRACDGDPVRAATIIKGEVACDPRISADSSIALHRALARVAGVAKGES